MPINQLDVWSVNCLKIVRKNLITCPRAQVYDMTKQFKTQSDLVNYQRRQRKHANIL